jgi:signal peptidase II
MPALRRSHRPEHCLGERRLMLVRGLGTAMAVVVLDQLSKTGVREYFAGHPAGEHENITPFFNIVLIHNRGMSFGLFNHNGGLNAVLFSLVAAVIVTVLIYWLSRVESSVLAVAIGLIIGGAIGNVLDRIRLGAVVDFLDFHIGTWHWPAFNVADSAICIGVAVMLLDGLLLRREAH